MRDKLDQDKSDKNNNLEKNDDYIENKLEQKESPAIKRIKYQESIISKGIC